MAAEASASDLGRYRLGRLLGRGGMGEVYLAHDQTLDRDVAIKFVSTDKVGDEAAGRRLLHEALSAASLDHPCICTVYETGRTPEGQAFIVMQYVEGQPLSAMLQAGPLPVRDVLSIAVNIAEALGAAHRRGIIHRDLKPSNVMVTPSGRPKLLDFGIARQVVLPASAVNAPTWSGDSTTAGTIIGTPAYMSPEQIQQRPLDGRSDLFSLGVLLFESLTGRSPFEGPSTLESIANVLHLHPPAASSLRRELTDRHDELCRRLMAKEASDRFQSAEEVVGAIKLLIPDTSRIVVPADDRSLKLGPGVRVSRRSLIAAAAVAVVAIAGFTIWRRPSPLPPVPPEADVWYQRGVEAIREGAYLSGQRALEQAISLYPEHVLAYARLADANIELDDERAAQTRLLRVSALVPDESRLPELERLRVQAVRAFFLRDVDAAVALHRQLVDRQPQDAGAWLDLGRAQEAAGLRSDARESYQQAIERDRQYAPAYLRLGFVEGLGSRRTESLAAFGEAERLYRASSNVEGETEVLLRRGAMYDAIGEGRQAKPDLERAQDLAEGAKAAYQHVRIRLTLGSVAASEGRFEEAAKIASAAVQDALASGLETIAADGLIDLTARLMQLGRHTEAREQLARALQLAEQRGARRTTARAKVQLASAQEGQAQHREALATVSGVLPFLKSNRYRRFELLALSVASRAHENLDELDKARQISSEVLASAEAVKDDSQVALAANNLASVTATLGHYPDALRLRERAEAIHRRQGDKASLPYDLANRADLLIRLGRGDQAVAALDEIDAGIAADLPSYKSRARRVAFLRLFAAGTALRCDEVDRRFRQRPTENEAGDAPGVVGPAIAEFCRARLGRRPATVGPVPDDTPSGVVGERAYWRAAAALERGEPGVALEEVNRGLGGPGALPPDELRWRLAALGSTAARQRPDPARASELAEMSRLSLERLRTSWKNAFAEYGKRSDVVYLIRRTGQT
jgi:tetratricopeptide (TPR) repeat protein